MSLKNSFGHGDGQSISNEGMESRSYIIINYSGVS